MEKQAPVDFPVISLIRRRWSPRAFDEKPIPEETIGSLFEAARWAPSSYNEQPWFFFYGHRERHPIYELILASLSDQNRQWARSAPLLIAAGTRLTFERNGRINRHAHYDLGQAVAHLVLQAMETGLFCHQMAGFSPEKLQSELHLPESWQVVTVVAVGYPGEPMNLPENLLARETAPRFRNPQRQFVFTEPFSKNREE